MKAKLMIGAAAALGAAYLAWKHRGALFGTINPCGAGSTFKRWNADELATLSKWSPPVQAQVRLYGGTCVKRGNVENVNLADLASDGYLITSPSQLP